MKSDQTFLRHILEAIEFVEQFTYQISKEDFLTNFMIQHAVIRNLEVMGEASRNVSQTTKDRLPSIPWRDINSMRNKLIHEYFGTDAETVWVVVQSDLPELKKQILEILKSDFI